MISNVQCKVCSVQAVFVVIFFKTMYNKTIILGLVLVISYIIKVLVSVISLALWLS